MIRVLIIEDEIIIARYIVGLLEENFDWEVHIAIHAAEAALEMEVFRPHLVLCDINLQDGRDGIQLIGDFRREYDFETVFITSYDGRYMVERAILLRPANYIIKPFDEKQFVATMKMTASRLPDTTATPALANTASPDFLAGLNELLTESEYKVLTLIARNHTSREIAGLLYISPLTVKNHRHNISRKLNLGSGNNSILKWAMANAEKLLR